MNLADIQEFDINQLLDPSRVAEIETLGDDAMFDEPKEAQEFFYTLHNFLNKYKDDFSRNPEIMRRYTKVLVTMFWKGFHGIEDNLKKVYVSKFLVFSVTQGLDPLPPIKRYLDFFEKGFVPDAATRNMLIGYLMENDETIGREMIQFKTGEKVASTAANWLKDYASSLPDNPGVQGGFDKVSYLTNSVNIRKLSPEEKDLLSKVIDIYRFLKNPQRTMPMPSRNMARPVPAATPRPPVPAAPRQPVPPAPARPASLGQPPATPTFEQKLAQISVPATHGQSLEALKHNLEEKGVAPGAPAAPATRPAPPMTPQEIKREVATPELPTHKQTPVPKAPAAPQPPLRPIPQAPLSRPQPARPPAVPTPVRGGMEIKVMDDLKKIDANYLRQGPLPVQISSLRAAILNLARANKVLPYYAMYAFEQSPLFQAYVSHGNAKFGGAGADGGLSQPEFEAVADLRKDLERL